MYVTEHTQVNSKVFFSSPLTVTHAPTPLHPTLQPYLHLPTSPPLGRVSIPRDPHALVALLPGRCIDGTREACACWSRVSAISDWFLSTGAAKHANTRVAASAFIPLQRPLDGGGRACHSIAEGSDMASPHASAAAATLWPEVASRMHFLCSVLCCPHFLQNFVLHDCVLLRTCVCVCAGLVW